MAKARRIRIEMTHKVSPEFAALIEGVVRRLVASGRGPEPDSVENGTARRRRRRRRGELAIYRGPYIPFAVVALDDLGGRAHLRDIFKRGKELLVDQLKPADEEPVSPTKPFPRWRYRLSWALTMAGGRGYMKPKGNKTGTWLLTEKGKRMAGKFREQIERGELKRE